MSTARKARLSPASYPSTRLTALGLEAWQWVRKHRRESSLAAGGIAALLIICISVAVYLGYKRRQGLDALRSGMLALQEGTLEEAQSELERAGRVLSSGGARQLALFYLGEAYLRQGETEAARKAFEESVAGGSGGEQYVSQLAVLQLGKVAEEAGELTMAAQRYTQAADIEGPGRSDAILSAARVLEENQEPEAAQEQYKKFVEAYPNSPLAEVIQAKILEAD